MAVPFCSSNVTQGFEMIRSILFVPAAAVLAVATFFLVRIAVNFVIIEFGFFSDWPGAAVLMPLWGAMGVVWALHDLMIKPTPSQPIDSKKN